MDDSRYAFQLEKLRRFTETVIRSPDIPMLGRAVKESMQGYQDIWLGIIDGDEVLLYDVDRTLRFPMANSLVGWVAGRGESLMINDIRKDHRYYSLSEHDPTLSELVVPIIEDHTTIGVLDIHADRTDAFTDEDLSFAQSLSRVLSVAIRNARLYQELQLQTERLSLISEVSADLTLHHSVSAVVDRTMHIISGHLGYAYAGIALVEGDELVVKALNDSDSFPEQIATLRMKIGLDGVGGLVAQTGKAVIIPDNRKVSNYIGNDEAMRSAVLVPILLNTRVLGVINVESPTVSAFTVQDMNVLQTVANQVAVALENARLYTELQETQALLVQAERLRAVGELAAGVAHNFNNLLTSVIGYTELLQSEPSLSIYRPYFDTIMQSARQGARLARQLRQFSRLQSSIALSPLDLNEIILEAARAIEPQWRNQRSEAHSIQMVQRLVALPPIAGITLELVEVFTNLIQNATDAMPEGGELTLTTTEDGGFVTATVADTGMGMDQDTINRVFEPFYTTKGPAVGLGLGMSVVLGILKRHGGTISTQSQRGVGTSFQLVLPVQIQETTKSPGGTDEIAARQRILIIDDDANVSAMMTRMLSDHEVAVTDSGSEGIRLFNRDRHDLVLTDIGMSGLSGWNVARLVHQADPTVFVLAISGWERGDAPSQTQVSGIEDFLKKPFTRGELLAAVAKAIVTRQARLSAAAASSKPGP